ncbi:hypothetical protein D3C85_681030 [compost metagenome]
MTHIKVGDTVYLPCKVVGISQMAYSKESVIDVIPLEKESQEMYNESRIKRLTVYLNDVEKQNGI